MINNEALNLDNIPELSYTHPSGVEDKRTNREVINAIKDILQRSSDPIDYQNFEGTITMFEEFLGNQEDQREFPIVANVACQAMAILRALVHPETSQQCIPTPEFFNQRFPAFQWNSLPKNPQTDKTWKHIIYHCIATPMTILNLQRCLKQGTDSQPAPQT